MICPDCRRAYTDPEQGFCVEDGARLVAAPEPHVTDVKPTSERGQLVAGRYAVVGLIGEGGISRVYLAEDEKTGERVAVKIMKREQVANRLARERFLREVDVAAKIGHPNVVRILDAGERADRSPFLVLEYLSGETAGELLDREGALAPEIVLPILRWAAAGLAAAHAAGVVHRDVKPDNMFLVAGGLKVVDFGVAKLKEGTVTGTGMALGTVPYMAPEQALADSVDGRTDVWGLGVSAFHLLTGRLPFEGEDDAQVTARVLYAPATAPSATTLGLDPRVDRVVAAAMRKSPDNRYASMTAMLEDLERLMGERPGELAGAPVRVSPDGYEPRNPMSKTTARFLRGLLR